MQDYYLNNTGIKRKNLIKNEIGKENQNASADGNLCPSFSPKKKKKTN